MRSKLCIYASTSAVELKRNSFGMNWIAKNRKWMALLRHRSTQRPTLRIACRSYSSPSRSSDAALWCVTWTYIWSSFASRTLTLRKRVWSNPHKGIFRRLGFSNHTPSQTLVCPLLQPTADTNVKRLVSTSSVFVKLNMIHSPLWSSPHLVEWVP